MKRAMSPMSAVIGDGSLTDRACPCGPGTSPRVRYRLIGACRAGKAKAWPTKTGKTRATPVKISAERASRGREEAFRGRAEKRSCSGLGAPRWARTPPGDQTARAKAGKSASSK